MTPGTRVRTPAGIGVIECQVPGRRPLWIVVLADGGRRAFRPDELHEIGSDTQQDLFTEGAA